jgi:hypothetical protein
VIVTDDTETNNNSWVMLRALVKDSKLEIIDKFYVEKVPFCCFNGLNAQFPR